MVSLSLRLALFNALCSVSKRSYETRDFEAFGGKYLEARKGLSEILLSFFSTSFFCVCLSTMMMMMMMTTVTTLIARVVLHVRIANQVGEDSSCRGGIVHSRDVCSRAQIERPESPKALWRFRVSTSNSPSGRSWLHPYT